MPENKAVKLTDDMYLVKPLVGGNRPCRQPFLPDYTKT
jgi:hypothetical protein